MAPAGWLDDLPGAASQALEALPECHLGAGTNKFTLLASPAGGIGRPAAGGWVGKASRRQRLTGVCDPGGERRHLFGVGEGPTEAVAEAKQNAWNGSTQAGVRNKMRNNDLRFGYGHASVALRSPS